MPATARPRSWERDPQVVLHDELLAGGHAHEVLAALDPDAELLETVQDRYEVGLVDAVDRHVAAGNRREADKASHLDVIGADLPIPAAQRIHTVDPEHVRLDAVDLRAQRDEEATEV